MSAICIICARGGSKGLEDKNIRPLLGKPLLAWTIEQARASTLFDAVAVSSDSGAILEAARAAGAGVLVDRPAELATDTVSVLPAIVHCLRTVEAGAGREFKTLVFLQVTSPTRSVEDVRKAVVLFEEACPDAVVSGHEAKGSPYFNLVEIAPDGCIHLSKTLEKPVMRRQEAPACFQLNGSIYVWRRSLFCAAPAVLYPRTRLFVMPAERSIDIDTEFDFALAEFVMSRRAGVTPHVAGV